jgi:hypothetical protein
MYVYDLDQLGPADADADGSDNLADCAPDDAAAFAVPGEVTGLVLDPDRETLRFDSAAPGAGAGAVHQVLRGRVSELPVGSGASETCVEPGTTATTAADPELPPADEVFWYLVRARNACGAGGYGTTSDETPRTSAGCP